ncbi:MAG: SGNH/GDSL hydrolase family protein [Ruminococcaceae bacterium]|nr:SGNH/GDSL hydrolase family protein [Oscillospiraceae bacterium]
MKLTTEQITSAARGVSYVSEENKMVRFHRFTREQEELYSTTSPEFYAKAFATAGVVLEFDTDSRNMALSVAVRKGSSRPFFVHSIFVNDQPVGRLEGDLTTPEQIYAAGNWSLGDGDKRVKLLFPWSASSLIQALELDDGASFTPVVKTKNVLCFGDSITQGYAAARPEESYASILAKALDANCLNKAIGGEVFRVKLSKLPDEGPIDLITVAYGTNDWFFKDADSLHRHATEFCSNLRKNYPDTKIVIMAPVWRGDWQKTLPSGEFRNVAATLEKIADQIGNALFIDCFDFIPHDPAYYSPDVLHPNSDGFRIYGQRLADRLKQENII